MVESYAEIMKADALARDYFDQSVVVSQTLEQARVDYNQLQDASYQLEQDLQSLKDSLAKTDGYIPFLSSKELREYVHDTGIWANEYKEVVYDCDDYALDLFNQACIDRRPIGLCWDRDGNHMMCFAIVKVRDTYRLYFVNPGDGLVWDSGTTLD